MKKAHTSIAILTVIVLAACSPQISDSTVQTVVSEVIMTSSSGGESDTQDESINQAQSELVELKSQLQVANISMTEQANTIIKLEDELEGVYLLLTPTNTEVPTITPSPTLGFTSTPQPTATESSGLLYNQKYVITNSSAPIFTFTTKNKNGAPIMTKTDPVRQIKTGEKLIVDWHIVTGDGGVKFYQIQSSNYFGYYVRVSDVYDYQGP